MEGTTETISLESVRKGEPRAARPFYVSAGRLANEQPQS
jgi:hypothetical protein